MIETTVALEPFEVSSLDVDTLLWLTTEAEVQDRRAGRRKLNYALRMCQLHPGTDQDHADWGDGERGPNRACDLPLGGGGSPLVAAGAVEAFATALGCSTVSAQCLMADALDLHHRLPHIWTGLQALAFPVWKARRVATLTRSLPPEAAAWVDTRLAERLAGVGLPTIEKTVLEATAVFCPEQIADSQADRANWDVRLHHDHDAQGVWSGDSFLDAVGDTADLTALHDLACAVAEALSRAGDPDTLAQRKAKALGLIGRGHHTDPAAIARLADAASRAATPSDAGSAADADPDTDPDSGTDPDAAPADAADPDHGEGISGIERAGSAARDLDADVFATVPATSTLKPERRRPGTPTKLYLHVSAADLATSIRPGTRSGAGFGRVERLGPATLDLLRSWLGHDRVSVTPVIDPTRDDAVDQHDPPEWMREQVILRDQHCIFPWCHTDGRSCDLDHIDPYIEDGPPGQTRPENLAPLCRRHHRAKTFLRWRYRRLRDGSYRWQTPTGHHFHVDTENGTIRLDGTRLD